MPRRKASDITVRLGEHDLAEESVEERDFVVSNVLVHERFSGTTNDIALLELSQKVDLSGVIKPIGLPPSDIVLDNRLATVAGELELVDNFFSGFR